MKKHKGNGTGSPEQPPGRRRGPETGTGFTASTGRGKPDKVEFRDSRLRTIPDVKKGK